MPQAAPVAAPVTPVSGPAVAAEESSRVLSSPGTAAPILGVLAALALVGMLVAGFLAFRLDSGVAMVAALALGAAAIVLFGARSAARPAQLVLQGGRLDVFASQGHYVFDLASPYTSIDVVGQPGERSWKVLFKRRNMSPFVVDSSMVDAEEFMAVLRHYRPAGTSDVSSQ